MKVLWIGNSYTQRNDLPALVAQMALAQEPSMVIEQERVIANGASLRQHWNAGEVLEQLRQGGWDYVVLQEQSTLPLKNAARYHENVHLFAPEIAASSARPVLYLTWARQNARESQAALSSAVVSIGREIEAIIAPVGVAWQALLQEQPHLNLYDKDGSHPSPLGSYVAACVFYEVLCRQSCIGAPVPAHLNIEPATAAFIQQLAHRVAATGISS